MSKIKLLLTLSFLFIGQQQCGMIRGCFQQALSDRRRIRENNFAVMINNEITVRTSRVEIEELFYLMNDLEYFPPQDEWNLYTVCKDSAERQTMRKKWLRDARNNIQRSKTNNFKPIEKIRVNYE